MFGLEAQVSRAMMANYSWRDWRFVSVQLLIADEASNRCHPTTDRHPSCMVTFSQNYLIIVVEFSFIWFYCE